MNGSHGDSIWDRWSDLTRTVKPPVTDPTAARPQPVRTRAALPAGMATIGVVAIAIALIGSHVISTGPAATESPEPSSSSIATASELPTASESPTATEWPSGSPTGLLTLPPTSAPQQPSGTFASTGSMKTARAYGTATLLQDGRVLIAGGMTEDFHCLSSAELYDPRTGRFSPTGSMMTARESHTATLLNDGRVLIAGGVGNGGIGQPYASADFMNPLSSAELYDPGTGRFTPTGPMGQGRDGSATLLRDGKVLVVGGQRSTGARSAEVYDPATATFSSVGSMGEALSGTATLLPNGKVLVTGVQAVTAELFDPTTRSFSPTGSMGYVHQGPTATLLQNGTVLLVGGTNDQQRFAELYDPKTEMFSRTGSTIEWRSGGTATLLPDGRVLIAQDAFVGSDRAELYNPATGTFTATGHMSLPRYGGGTATLLANGLVLIAGGISRTAGPARAVASAELYRP